jgi:hypothetical protein
MKKLLSIAAVALAAIWSAPASATPVTDWSYTVTSAWAQDAVFSSNVGTFVDNGTEISWGGAGSLVLGGQRSGVVISGSPASGTVVTNGPVAPTQTISHTNNPISSSFGTLLTTGLNTSLTLAPTAPNPPFNGTPNIGPVTLNFQIHFSETLNQSPCAFPSTSVCDDIFVIDFGSLNNQFVFDGETYFTSIVPLNGALVPLPAASCAQAGHSSPCLGFQTQEAAITAVPFGFLITSNPVSIPEPGTMALAGLALLGAGLARRRARKS